MGDGVQVFVAAALINAAFRVTGQQQNLLVFWSLIHIPDDETTTVLDQFRRVLRPGGPLLLGFHVGDGSRLKTQGYGGHPMKVYVRRRQPDEVAGWLRDAGFTVNAQMLFGPDESRPGAALIAHRRRHRPDTAVTFRVRRPISASMTLPS